MATSESSGPGLAAYGRAAYLGRSLQTGALAIVVIDVVKIGLGVAVAVATKATPGASLSTLDRYASSIATTANQVVAITLLLAVVMSLAPWFIGIELPWTSLRKTRPVLIVSALLAVILGVAATLNVRANLVTRKPVTNSLRLSLAAYLVEMLGLAVIIMVGAAAGMGATRSEQETEPGEPAASEPSSGPDAADGGGAGSADHGHDHGPGEGHDHVHDDAGHHEHDHEPPPPPNGDPVL